MPRAHLKTRNPRTPPSAKPINIPAKIPPATVARLRLFAAATGHTQASIIDRALTVELDRIKTAGGRSLTRTLNALERTRNA